MKVVNTSDASHSITFIPREYILEDTILELKNEATKEVSTVVHTITGLDALLILDFDFDFTEGDRFQIKLYDITTDIFRGRLIATDQTIQEYDTTEQYYTYE